MNWPGAAARRTSMARGARRPARCARSSPPRRRRAGPRRRWRSWWPCRARPRAPARCPQTITSPLSRRRRGAPSLAPAVSAARSAKPSTLARSNGGTSTGAAMSCASTRPSDSASATLSPGSGDRSMCRTKRARASSAETTSRNCSWRAAWRMAASRSVGIGVSLEACRSWQRSYHDLGAGRISFAFGRHQDPAVGLRQRRERQIARGYGLGRADRRSAPAPPRPGPRSTTILRASVAMVAGIGLGSRRKAAPACGGRAPSHTANAASSRPGSAAPDARR